MPQLPSVRLHGDPSRAGPLVARLRELGVAIVDDAAEIELVVSGEPPVRRAPVVAVAHEGDDAPYQRMRSGVVVDVIPASASAAELAARLRRARAQSRQSDDSELARHLELLSDLATLEDLPALLLRIVSHLAAAVAVERCSLMLVDEHDSAEGVVVASSDHAEPLSIRVRLADYPEVREARRTGRPVLVADAARDPLVGEVSARLERAGVGSVACFPLKAGGRFLGVLMLRTRSPMRAGRDLGLAATVASATAIAVQHARLVERVREAATREIARYEAFVSQLSDGVAVLGSQLDVVMLNPAGAALFGLDAPKASGAHLFDLAVPSDPVAAGLLKGAILRGSRVRSADLEVRLPSGRRAVFAFSAGPLRDQVQGHAILAFRDVTEERATAAELRRTMDFLERLIDASSDAIVAVDLQGRILVFSRAAEVLFGVSAETARATLRAHDLSTADDAREIMRLVRESPVGRIDALRCHARSPLGERVPVEVSAALVRHDGREEAVVALMRDLRERDRVEAELADTRTRLVEVEKQRAVTALAGATAHELNQPLTVVIGLVELLRRRLTDEAHRRSLDTIGAEADRMAQIVRKIASLTRLETVAYPGEREILDLDRSSSRPR